MMRLLKSVKRIWKAIGYSFYGIRAAYKHEQAFRQEVWLAAVLIPLTCFLSLTPVQRILLIGSVCLVLIVELINSAIEAVVDYVSTKKHPLAGRAKDLGSAAVMISILNGIVIWVLVLI